MESLMEIVVKLYSKITNGYIPKSVSRLDQPTSGVFIIPLTKDCELYLTELFKNKMIKKKYICLVYGKICNMIGFEGSVESKLKHENYPNEVEVLTQRKIQKLIDAAIVVSTPRRPCASWYLQSILA
jgi:23S rRNA-/tRNA-specific pseudouridylate synthase